MRPCACQSACDAQDGVPASLRCGAVAPTSSIIETVANLAKRRGLVFQSGEIYGGTIRDEPERAARALHAATRLGPRRGYYYQLAASTGWSSLPFLGLIRQPTLVLAGDDDPIVPVVNARLMARFLPDARLHVYRGGHVALVTEAPELAPVVEAFLDG